MRHSLKFLSYLGIFEQDTCITNQAVQSATHQFSTRELPLKIPKKKKYNSSVQNILQKVAYSCCEIVCQNSGVYSDFEIFIIVAHFL